MENFGFLTPEYKRIFKVWLEALVKELKELGLDYWVPHSVWIENEELLTFLKSTGKPVDFYTCKSNSKNLSPLKHWRWHGHFVWKYGLTGLRFWGYDVFQEDPLG